MESSLYRTDAPGDWGITQAPAGGKIGSERLTAPGRPDIFYRYWIVNAPATLFILHGLGAHSGWFIDMGNAIAAKGINVFAMDHQGFGRSGGARGYVQSAQEYLTDIDRMTDFIHHELPGTEIFLLGHSMGGVFAIQYAADFQQKLGGVILMNPWIADTAKLGLGSMLSIFVGGLFGSKEVVVLPDDRNPSGMTTNATAAEMLKQDPYWVSSRTKRFYYEITLMRQKTMSQAAKITIPLLTAQAEKDLAVSPAATKQAHDRIPAKDKTFKQYANYAHDSEFEADRTELDGDIAQWILSHSAHKNH